VNNRQDHELFAVWEQRFQLVEVSDPDGTRHFTVDDLDERGVVVDSTRYAYDDFPLAADDYNRRTVRTLDPMVASLMEIGLNYVSAVACLDHEALAAVLHDDHVFIDHRPISYPAMNKTGMVEAVVAQADIVQIWLFQELHDATSTTWIVTGSFWTINVGRWAQYEHGVYLNVADNGQLARVEVFPDDQLDKALARFAALTASQ
jgi:hypothetical protein